MKSLVVSLFVPLAAWAASQPAETTPALRPLPVPAVPEVAVPAVNTTVEIRRPATPADLPPRPIAPAPELRAVPQGGEFAYVRVIGDDADFEVVRELPPGSAGLADLRIPVFARLDMTAEDALKKAALSVDWGRQNIREFEEVSAPVRKPSPDGTMLFWFAPRADVVARYADTPNPARRVRLSYRQPLLRGRVVYAASWPAVDFDPKAERAWHRTLLVRSLRANVLGKVTAGVEHERLGDSLFVFLRDEAYVEIVAAPPAPRATQP